MLSDPYQRGRYDEQRARGEGTVDVVDGDAVPVKTTAGTAPARVSRRAAAGSSSRSRASRVRRPFPTIDIPEGLSLAEQKPRMYALDDRRVRHAADLVRPADRVQRPPHRTLVPGRARRASPSSATTRPAATRASSKKPRTRPTTATRPPTRPRTTTPTNADQAARHGRRGQGRVRRARRRGRRPVAQDRAGRHRRARGRAHPLLRVSW